MKILLDYVLPVSIVLPTPQASTGFLKQACLVVKPKVGQEGHIGEVIECNSMAEVTALTNNTDAQQLFNAGMSRVFILPADDLDLDDVLNANQSMFYTLLISSDFGDADVTDAQAGGTITVTSYENLVSGTPDTINLAGQVFTAQTGTVSAGSNVFQAATSNDVTASSLAAQINAHASINSIVEAQAIGAVITITAKAPGQDGNSIALSYTDNDTNVGLTLSGLTGGNLSGGAGSQFGNFGGVVGISSKDVDFCQAQAAINSRCAFYTNETNGAKNMCYAFGKLLSNQANWTNQQYIQMPFNDDVDTVGEANSLFDKKISFVIHDDEFSNRLAFFGAGGAAISAPYIYKNLIIDLQSETLSWIAANQPSYTLTEAALLEQRLQEHVINIKYVQPEWIPDGSIEIVLRESNFVGTGYIEVTEPKALWRMFSEMRVAS